MFKPQDHIIGEHVAYMMFNVMKVSIAENDKEFNPEKYRNLSDVPPSFWAYPYMSAPCFLWMPYSEEEQNDDAYRVGRMR